MRECRRQPVALAVLAFIWGVPVSWAQTHDEAAHAPLTEVTITARPDQANPFLAPTLTLSGAALTQKQGSTRGKP
jgi:hypothetical protein